MADISTGLPAIVDRHMSPQALPGLLSVYEGSSAVDTTLIYDQLLGFFQNSLWTPENTPLAELMPDCESFCDAFVLAGMAAASSGLGLLVTTDAIRRGPTELAQAMMTLARATSGKATLLIGAGEQKQIKPFGHKRREGLSRLEDFFQLWHKFLAGEPFDHDGQHWTMRNAYLGSETVFRPKVWAMGAGPRLLDLASRYADGWMTVVPYIGLSPERFGEQIARLRSEVERHGRDPDSFDICVVVQTGCHEDPEIIDRYLDNPILRFVAGVFGRLNMADWRDEGLTPVFPDDWHYALRYIPTEISASEASAIVDKVPKEMVAKSWVSGTPKDVAATALAYAEAGATCLLPADLLQLVLPIEEAMAATDRMIEVCRLVKEGSSRH